MTVVILSLAGAVGAVFRYVISGRAQQIASSPFPVGTTIVNLTGALVMGLLAGGAHLGSWWVLCAWGFLGGFTTFSTWMVETLRLVGTAEEARAFLNLGGMLVAGLGVAALAMTLVSW